MKLKTPAMKISIALILLLANLLFLAEILGFVPDASKAALEMRKSLSESLALQFSTAAEKGEFQTIQKTLRAVVARNKTIRSAAIRTQDGKLVALAGEHLSHWDTPADGKSTATHVLVPVFRKNNRWATVEMRFAPLWANDIATGFTNSFIGLLGFITLSGFICYFFVLKRTLRELDPSAVIPERVQAAFNILQEGVLILDEREQIVMANQSFANLFDKSTDEMVGRRGSELGWQECNSPKQAANLPWSKVMQDGKEQKGASLSIQNSYGKTVKLAVYAAKVTDNSGKCRGTLVTFDDITQLEEKNFELGELVNQLRLANKEIKFKSAKLKNLASHDALTQCLNRRSLSHRFDRLFSQTKQTKDQLSCLMLDIDLFKSVNDRYGHATGDEVIKAVAQTLKACTRSTDLVGRYGGEEFCAVLPKLNLDQAIDIAERIRKTVEDDSCSGIKITISIGVASLDMKANSPEELINQADKALYAAKKSGRNRVIAWGRDANFTALLNREEKPGAPVSTTESPTDTDIDIVKLKQRIHELEGLLEKRAIELEHLDMYDTKTGLPTRTLFEDRISHEIARAKRKNHLVVILSMKIETIKRIHETLGYKAAEQLMTLCAQRLQKALREDVDMVALVDRKKWLSSISLINDGEFGILLNDIQQADHVTWVIKRMLDAFEEPFHVKGNEIYTNAYFGVSIFPHDAETVEGLYRCATYACSYARKIDSKERYYFSSQSLNDMAVNQLKIENELHHAIENDELQLYYQPKIESITGQIAGFEALLRWKSPKLGQVPPNQFITVAEQSGLINSLGDWVLYTACQQLRTWLDMDLAVVPVAVNISGVQLRQRNLAYQIETTMKKFKIDAHLIEIELTESSLVNIYDKAFKTLKEIRALGLNVAMDDFGSGYSSLSYLKNIPLTALKIDRSFIADINKDNNAERLIASIISLAHGLGLEVVAEGVEEKYQADHLAALGCEYLQGYYFGRPAPNDDAVKLLHKQAAAIAG